MKDCPGAHSLHGNVRIVGCEQEEHDKNLHRVVCKYQEDGLKVQYDGSTVVH